jgi:hypothetical protein
MNVQKLFNAIKDESDQPTLIIATIELERQGYNVTLNKKYHGSRELTEAEGNGDLQYLPMQNGILIEIKKGKEKQSFRLQMLDLDSVCITSLDSHPVIYNPEFTTEFYKSKRQN